MASICRRIPCRISELRLDKTLVCGQSFRWQETTTPGEWVGVMGGYVWKLWQSNTELFYEVLNNNEKNSEDKNLLLLPHVKEIKKEPKQRKSKKHKSKSNSDVKLDCHDTLSIKSEPLGDTTHSCGELTDSFDDKFKALLWDYLRLDIDLGDLYDQWSKVDSNFKATAAHFRGVRILRQDPVENLFSFICSSNNHISRISSMVEKLCQTYGVKLAEVKGQPHYSFPSIESLAQEGVEDRLRQLGFGYRAKYIYQTALYIQNNHSEQWLYSLRQKSYPEAKKELVKLCGVGAKVADCVCLMSLDKLESVPVDTHVWQIAARDYIPQLRQAKSLTDKLYNQIGDHFRTLWGDKAGWAHSVLFTADLRQFKQPNDKQADIKGLKRSNSNEELKNTKKKK